MNKGSSRHEIRGVTLQALFPLDLNTGLTKENAIFDTIELNHRDTTNEDESEFVPAYLDTLVDDVRAKKDELDKVIEKRSKSNWHINRVSEMGLVILHVVIFEMTYVTDVPAAVALNEVIELAETFSDDRPRKFINGVLSNVLKELEAGA